MKIIITLEDTENGEVSIEEERLPVGGENVESVTAATALADEMFDLVDKLAEQKE